MTSTRTFAALRHVLGHLPPTHDVEEAGLLFPLVALAVLPAAAHRDAEARLRRATCGVADLDRRVRLPTIVTVLSAMVVPPGALAPYIPAVDPGRRLDAGLRSRLGLTALDHDRGIAAGLVGRRPGPGSGADAEDGAGRVPASLP